MMEQEANSPDQSQETDKEAIFRCAEELHYIAHQARLQAYEAEMRADYAISLADRAVEESQAVHDIAESLTRTARIVAKISLEEKIDPQGIFSSIINHDVSKEFPPGCVVINGVKYKPRPLPKSHQSGWYAKAATPTENLQNLHLDPNIDDEKHNESCDKISPLVGSSSGSNKGDPSTANKRAASVSNRGLEESESMHSSRPTESEESLKYDDSFPDDEETLDSKAELIRGLDSVETLPIVYEDSYQGPRDTRSIPWSEKKTLRKIQRKLKDLDMADEEDGMDDAPSSPDTTTVADQSIRPEEMVKQEEMAMSKDSSTGNI